MCLEYYGPLGHGKIYLDDDATDEEIAQKLMIAATVEQGNGSGRVKKVDGLVPDENRLILMSN